MLRVAGGWGMGGRGVWGWAGGRGWGLVSGMDARRGGGRGGLFSAAQHHRLHAGEDELGALQDHVDPHPRPVAPPTRGRMRPSPPAVEPRPLPTPPIDSPAG